VNRADFDPALEDPILRHLPQDPPQQLLVMPKGERGKRARVFLLLWGAGYEQVMAWALAMGPQADVDELYDGWVAQVRAAGAVPDEVIDKMMADRALLASVAGRRAAQA